MAGASDKKLAVANTQTLKSVHTVSLAINVLALLVLFVFHRPGSKKPFIFFSLPLVGAEYAIERFGRPKYDGKVVVLAGADLTQQGVTEWLFDIVYFTLALDVLMILFGSNKVWWLWLAIPGYAGYKSFGFLKGLKEMFMGSSSGKKAAEGAKVEPTKSKRQAKMEARSQRAEKGSQQARYR
ncbi:hypothetical protein BABINDRAFT_161818 [Babjeviella inositovora NRRL Y-12698]|uniref:DUF788-domain-containing protein n=1 Tax=Babjeviella inositovora NRRL Y-12698 TaxID=984486 RepID=A0A1E3QNX7_9ASCO|nr:uncharacterized protein BABINDRAFT_161818 [Babjeviella inositovora NRRL Y-12698]ODQ79416.1 hypothetical protein BABINDRAFT_161818 [Babjeviella inositovora NRRL Y-12698]